MQVDQGISYSGLLFLSSHWKKQPKSSKKYIGRCFWIGSWPCHMYTPLADRASNITPSSVVPLAMLEKEYVLKFWAKNGIFKRLLAFEDHNCFTSKIILKTERACFEPKINHWLFLWHVEMTAALSIMWLISNPQTSSILSIIPCNTSFIVYGEGHRS